MLFIVPWGRLTQFIYNSQPMAHISKSPVQKQEAIANPYHVIDVNSSLPSATYIRQWTGLALVQIMACRLNGAKPLFEPVLTYCLLDPKEHISMKLKYFIQKHALQHVVCEMAAILSRGDEIKDHYKVGTWASCHLISREV